MNRLELIKKEIRNQINEIEIINPADFVSKITDLLVDEMFEAWKAGEINGKDNLSPNEDLDIRVSRKEFNKWLTGK